MENKFITEMFYFMFEVGIKKFYQVLSQHLLELSYFLTNLDIVKMCTSFRIYTHFGFVGKVDVLVVVGFLRKAQAKASKHLSKFNVL